MCWVPVADGLYVTWHVAELPLPLKVHWPLAGVNVPLPSLVNVTVPPGGLGVPWLGGVTMLKVRLSPSTSVALNVIVVAVFAGVDAVLSWATGAVLVTVTSAVFTSLVKLPLHELSRSRCSRHVPLGSPGGIVNEPDWLVVPVNVALVPKRVVFGLVSRTL